MKLHKLHEISAISEMIESDTGPGGERIDGKPSSMKPYDDINKRMKEVEDVSKKSSENVASQVRGLEQKLGGAKDMAQQPASNKGITPQTPSAHLAPPGGPAGPRPSAAF